MDWASVFFIAMGGALAFEGAAFAIFPAQMRRMYQQALSAGDHMLHMSGLFAVATGMVLILLAVR